MVTVVGSAGVGKSRLIWELEKYLDGLPDVYHWRKGRCLAYSGASFGPIADVVRADARILDDEPAETAREKLRERLSALNLADDEPAVEDALQAVLAIGEHRERPREELFEAWRRYLRAIARLEPLVLVVEDIHWADEGALSFLDFIARWGEGPMIILCLARHELLGIRPGWGGGLSNAATIDLEPLAPEATMSLMAGLLEGGVPDGLRDRIVELAEGNPLFTEEMVRMLIDRGTLRFVDGRWQSAESVDEIEIPGSVQAVLAARLDALPEGEKRLARDAAVVGRVFWDRLVAYLSREQVSAVSERLQRLRVKDLVIPREPSVLAGALEFGFRHALIRDVAYESLPKRDRAVLHREIAEWAEQELADRVEEFGELIAGHLAAAVAYAEEFDIDGGPQLLELRRLAFAAELRASRRAWNMSQADAAVRWLRQAIELAWTIDLPAREIAALALEYREMSFTIGDPDQQLAVATPALDALLALPDRTVDDDPAIARLRGMIGTARFHQNDVEGSRAMIRLAIEELGDGPWLDVRGYLYAVLGWTLWRAGPVAEAVPILETAVTLATEARDDHTLRWAKHDLGVALGMVGEHDASVAAVEESQRLAQDAGDHNLIMRCLINVPAQREVRGDDLGPIVEISEEAIRYARRAAAGSAVCWLAGNLGGMMLELGRFDEALAYRDEAVRTAETYVPDRLQTMLIDRALLHLLRGDMELAEVDSTAAAQLATDPDPQAAWIHVRERAAEAWRPDPAAALALSVAAMRDQSLPTEARARIAHLAARIALRLGAEPELTEAVALTGVSEKPASPRFDAWRAWEQGLVDGTDGATVERAARALEGLDLLALAVDAWSDAAILAARAGRPSDALDCATTLAAKIGMHPLLGPLPETRWLERSDAQPATEPSAPGGRDESGARQAPQ
jgi:tetratricopeptide (TPR) repeat protein